MKGSERFGKSARIQTRCEFMRVLGARRSAGDANLVVYIAPNDLGWNRLGISVSKRIGNSIDRHYVRRRIREAFRTSREVLPTSIDIVCVAQQGARERDHDVRSSLVALVRRASRRMRRRRKDSDGTVTPGGSGHDGTPTPRRDA